MSSFGEVLESFKRSEEPENLVPLIEDADLRNGVVAWKSVTLKNKPAEDCKYKDDASKWNGMWSRVEFEPTTFGVVAGVKPADTERLLKRLIGLRLIYPDGTIHTYASQYLQSIIMARLPRPKK